MTKIEFQNRMVKCKNGLALKVNDKRKTEYSCFTLTFGFTNHQKVILRNHYAKAFSKRDTSSAWFQEINKYEKPQIFEKNQATRALLLELFEQYMIDNKLYKEL